MISEHNGPGRNQKYSGEALTVLNANDSLDLQKSTQSMLGVDDYWPGLGIIEPNLGRSGFLPREFVSLGNTKRKLRLEK